MTAHAPVQPELSVVIPTWNRRERLEGALASLAAQSLSTDRFEIVVVDDGSSDGTAVAARRFAVDHPDLRVVVITQPNAGVNAARNAGIAASSGAAITLLDDDELAPTEHLARVSDALASHPDAPGIGGPCRAFGRSKVRTCPHCHLGVPSDPPVAPDGTARRLLGGNMTLRRSTLDEVGLFDAGLSGRGDETEWFARANRSFIWAADLFIWHRRDDVGLGELCTSGFRQGKAIPLLHDRLGRSWRPSPNRLARSLGHALGRRCGVGWERFSRELGATWEWLRRRSV